MWRAWKNMSIFIIFPLFIPLSEWFWSWSAQWEAGLAVCRPWPRTWNSQPSTPHGSQIFRCTVACFLCSTFDQRTERERCTRVIKIPWAFAGDMWKLLSKSCQCTFPNAKNVLLISVSWFEKKTAEFTSRLFPFDCAGARTIAARHLSYLACWLEKGKLTLFGEQRVRKILW